MLLMYVGGICFSTNYTFAMHTYLHSAFSTPHEFDCYISKIMLETIMSDKQLTFCKRTLHNLMVFRLQLILPNITQQKYECNKFCEGKIEIFVVFHKHNTKFSFFSDQSYSLN